MTSIDELLRLARDCEKRPPGSTGQRLGLAVIELLGEAQPCGWPEPVVDRGLSPVGITWDANPIGETILPDEARAIAVMLLRAADEADCG